MAQKMTIIEGQPFTLYGYTGIVRNPRVEWVNEQGENVIRFELESESFPRDYANRLPTFGGINYAIGKEGE